MQSVTVFFTEAVEDLAEVPVESLMSKPRVCVGTFEDSGARITTRFEGGQPFDQRCMRRFHVVQVRVSARDEHAKHHW